MTGKPLELVAPAGTPAALKAAVDAGADAVYLGFRDQTNARNFPGLNFSEAEFHDGLAYAQARDCKVFVAVNTFPPAGRPEPWQRAVDRAAEAGADALILADIGLLDYATRRHPDLRRHLSVQASASNPEAIRFYHEAFGIRRVVLPRVLTLDEIAALNRQVPVETEVFAFGGLCVMAEGRCLLSAYATGQSPNMNGVCSPASHVRYEQIGDTLVSRLGAYTINRFAPGAPAGYPTLCKGRFVTGGCASYLFEEPSSLNAIAILPDLIEAGVTALKIEGRQRGRAYVERIVAAFRRAVETAARGERLAPDEVAALTEGGKDTLGAYRKAWQ
jgi:putative protease